MTEQLSSAWLDPALAHALAEPVAPTLRLVDQPPPAPLGRGVLPEEETFTGTAVLRQRIPVTHDVTTFVLEPAQAATHAFSPGQFLTLGVEVDGVTVERCYTIASAPTRPHLLAITVKRTEGGIVSTFLHDRLGVGDPVSLSGPMGEFSPVNHPASGYLMLSAGSGITPTLSAVRTMADLGLLDGDRPDSVDVVVIHSARTPADLVYRAELEWLATAHAGLRLAWVCECDDAPGLVGVETPPVWWRGLLSAEVLTTVCGDLHEREVLTCGPPGYMTAARELLARLGADPTRCHEESFVLSEPSAPDLSGTDAGPVDLDAPATVRFARSGREAFCAPGATVLEAATAAGISLPSSCGQGLCGTCKSTLLAGHVEMNHLGGIRPREIAADKFLPCCSVPTGDIVVDA